MKEEIKAEYKCAQKDLYSVLTTVWENYGVHQARLEAYKPTKYTAALAGAAKARIDAAKALPDDEARRGKSEEKRVEVVMKAKMVLHNFQLLKGYIDEAFKDEKEPMRKPNYSEAGQGYYRDASEDDWESVSNLGSSMIGYIADKLAVLTNDGAMPAAFETEVGNSVSDFDKEYDKFKTLEQTQLGTEEKLVANNGIYAEGVEMMADAQKLFWNEPALRSMFVFTSLLDMVNPKVAGLKGLVKDSVTDISLAGVNVHLKPENEPEIVVVTDEEGRFSALRLRTGKYALKAELAGYGEFGAEVVVKEHVVSVFDFEMVKEG